MVFKYASVVLLLLQWSVALPTTPFMKLDSDLRYALVADENGKSHMVDLWLSLDDLHEAAKYNAETDNAYHLFTRNNPWTSQPLLIGNNEHLGLTNFDATKKTYIIIHGWDADANSPIFQHLIPAILETEDSNVIMVDWGSGAITDYEVAVPRAIPCGEHIAQMINWLVQTTASTADQFALFGHSLGGHVAGIAGRNVIGDVGYINSLDPASQGWADNIHSLRANDSSYTEVIHTNSGIFGLLTPAGHVDFYPNGGIVMAGCAEIGCSHNIVFVYLAESIRSGGFTGTLCSTYLEALLERCFNLTTLPMGGLAPKHGASGIYHLRTNAQTPYSQG